MKPNETNPGTQNCCKIDAFSCTFANTSIAEVIEDILHLGHLEWTACDYGRYGYRKMHRFGSITLLHDGRLDSMGICLELRSQGCSELINLTQNESIFHDILCYCSASLSRIDIAVDDFAGLVDMDTMVDKIERGEIRTRMKAATECKGLATTTGHTVYIGSAKSNCRIRIYDKSAQLKTTYHWIRTELVLRHEDAHVFQSLINQTIDRRSSHRDAQIVSLGMAVLAGKFSFIEPTDSNISRCPVSPWWSALLSVDPICINKFSKTIPDIEQAKEWIRKQTAPTLALLLCIEGAAWLEGLIEDGCGHMDLNKAKTWCQQLFALGATPVVNPLDNDCLNGIIEMLRNYYNISN